jgi:hypothetical protein
MVRALVPAASALILTAGAIAPPTQTIPEAVREHGDIEKLIVRQYAPVGMRELVTGSSLIVHGLVTGADGELSEDQRRIVTSYRVKVLQILARAEDFLNLDGTLVLQRAVGTIELEGRIATTRELGFPHFLPGEQYVFFLQRDPDGPAWLLPHGPQGAFVVQDGAVRQVSLTPEAWAKRHGTMSVDQLARDVALHASATGAAHRR